MATVYFDREYVWGIWEYTSVGVLRTELEGATVSAGGPTEIVMLVLSDGVGVEEILPAMIADTDQLCINDECWPYAWGGLRTKYISDERYSGRRTYPKV